MLTSTERRQLLLSLSLQSYLCERQKAQENRMPIQDLFCEQLKRQ